MVKRRSSFFGPSILKNHELVDIGCFCSIEDHRDICLSMLEDAKRGDQLSSWSLAYPVTAMAYMCSAIVDRAFDVTQALITRIIESSKQSQLAVSMLGDHRVC